VTLVGYSITNAVYDRSNMTQDAAVTQRKTSTPEKLIRTSSGGGLFKPSIIRDSLSSPGKGTQSIIYNLLPTSSSLMANVTTMFKLMTSSLLSQ